MRGEIIERLTAQGVTGADLHLVEPVEHVDLGQGDAGDPADRRRLAHQHRIEPAAAALAARDGAELMAAHAQPLAGFIVEFGRERTRSDARGVRLGDPQHEADRAWPQARSACRGARDGVGRGDEGIGAVVDVEQHALRTFEQDAASARALFAQHLPHRRRELKHEFGNLAQIGNQSCAVDRRLAEPGAQRVVMRGQPVELGVELVEMRQIAHPDRTPAHLVLIGGADAAPRRPDLARTRRILAQRVEITVKRQDQRAIVGDVQGIGSDGHALRQQLLDLCLQRPGIEHDAITDNAGRATDDTGGQQRQLVHRLPHDQRVTGIMSALKSDDDIGALGEPVDDLSLALVTPLGADHCDIGHREFPRTIGSARSLGFKPGKGKDQTGCGHESSASRTRRASSSMPNGLASTSRSTSAASPSRRAITSRV